MPKKFALERILEDRCVNANKLCKKLGIPRSTLYRIIKRGGGNTRTLQKIADALGVDITEFWQEVLKEEK